MQTDLLNNDFNFARVLKSVAENAELLTNALGALILVEEGSTLTCIVATGGVSSLLGERLQSDDSPSGSCVRTGSNLRYAHANSEHPAEYHATTRLAIGSIVDVPLRLDLGRRGRIRVVSSEGTTFNSSHVQTLELLAGFIATAVDRAKQLEAIEQLLVDRSELLIAQNETLERTSQLLQVSTALCDAMTMEQVADVIVNATVKLYDATIGMIVQLSDDNCTLKALRFVGVPADEAEIWKSFSADSHVPIADAVRQKRMLQFRTTQELDAAYPELAVLRPPSANGSALVALPLMVGDTCVGGLGIVCHPSNCSEIEQQNFLWTLANQCALALERARLYDSSRYELQERERAEAALRESEAHKSAVLEASLDCIITVDDAERVVEWNPASERVFGYSRNSALGKALSDLLFPGSSRNRNRLAFKKVLFQTSVDSNSLRSEVQVCDARGMHFPAELTAVTIQLGTRRFCTAYIRDITERKRLQEEQERALSEARDQADHDPLTGLLNHRAFHKRLEEETIRADRQQTNLAIAMLDLDNFTFFNDNYGHATGDEVLRMVATRLQTSCRLYDTIARFGGDEFAILLSDFTTQSATDIETRLRRELDGLSIRPNNQNTAIPITVSVGAVLYTRGSADRHEVLCSADARLLWTKTGGAPESEAQKLHTSAMEDVSGFTMLDALVTAVDNKDRYTRRHSEDVLSFSLMIARELGLSLSLQETISVAALLHDVGKVGVPDAILRKPGPLTPDEFEAIKQHPQMGAAIVSAVPGLENVLDAVRHHHERWDGGGYPVGLAGEDTPLIARVMSVSDAYSAMTTDRPYRKGMAPATAIEVLREGSGTQWDPTCVDALIKSQVPKSLQKITE